MNFEDICKELGLDIHHFTNFTCEIYKGGYYHPSFDMSQSLIWSIPSSQKDNIYCVAYLNHTEIAVLVDIEFSGVERPTVKGIFNNYNPNDPKLKELIFHGIELLNKYEPYVKKNQIIKRMCELEKDFV